MTESSQEPRAEVILHDDGGWIFGPCLPPAELAARRTAAAVLADYRHALASAPLSRPPGREWMLRLECALADLLAALEGPR